MKASSDRTDTRKDVCYVELNALAIQLERLLYMFFDCETGPELRGRHDCAGHAALAQGLGVEFAFPTQTCTLVISLAGDARMFDAIPMPPPNNLALRKPKRSVVRRSIR